jgi:hypothetical protein
MTYHIHKSSKYTIRRLTDIRIGISETCSNWFVHFKYTKKNMTNIHRKRHAMGFVCFVELTKSFGISKITDHLSFVSDRLSGHVLHAYHI